MSLDARCDVDVARGVMSNSRVFEYIYIYAAQHKNPHSMLIVIAHHRNPMRKEGFANIFKTLRRVNWVLYMGYKTLRAVFDNIN